MVYHSDIFIPVTDTYNCKKKLSCIYNFLPHYWIADMFAFCTWPLGGTVPWLNFSIFQTNIFGWWIIQFITSGQKVSYVAPQRCMINIICSLDTISKQLPSGLHLLPFSSSPVFYPKDFPLFRCLFAWVTIHQFSCILCSCHS